MYDKAKPGKPATAPSREQKLAAALRANLRRRKAPPPPKPGSAKAGGDEA
jgi:hypothetical protein